MNETPLRIGYARTSIADQNFEPQIAALQAAGCSLIRTEQKSGASLADRPELGVILDFIHAGETLVITRIDRLARSLADLQAIVMRLRARGAHLAATEQPIDTATAAGKAFFDMLGVFAEFETNLRRKRQAEGIAAARARGVYKGRPPRIDHAEITRRLAAGEGPTAIARALGISRGSVYKARGEVRA
jgi:DNA invertase Pin-like site-specific DNA recombinase